jgi:hypothetical protein
MTVLAEEAEKKLPYGKISDLTSSAKGTIFDPYPVATVRSTDWAVLPIWESSSSLIFSAVSLKSPPEGHSNDPKRPRLPRLTPFDEAEPMSIPNTNAMFLNGDITALNNL